MRPSASVIGELVNEVLYRKFCRLLLYVLVSVLRNDDYYGFLVDLIEWLYRLSYVNRKCLNTSSISTALFAMRMLLNAK